MAERPLEALQLGKLAPVIGTLVAVRRNVATCGAGKIRIGLDTIGVGRYN